MAADDLNLPSELNEKLSNFHESLANLENIITPILAEPLDGIHKKLTPLNRASFDLTMLYSLDSLFWMYLLTQGENPKEHNVKDELERIRKYMSRVKELKDRDKAPHLDAAAAKRFIMHSIPKDQRGNESESRTLAQSSAEKRKNTTTPSSNSKKSKC